MDKPAVITSALGGSALSRAAQAGTLTQWYRAVPRGEHAWQSYAKDVTSSVSSTWLEDLGGAITTSGAAGARLARSSAGQGVVVTTGQQPGLFGGPLMSLFKAIAARALADELQEITQIPVAPVFWAATDDADFDEAAVVSVALDGGARELRMEPRAAPGTPMTRVPLGHDVEDLVPLLRDACGSAPHASYVDSAVAAYHATGTVGDAYVAVLRSILEPLEIAVLDASHPSVARAAEPLLRRAVRDAGGLAKAVRARGEAITGAGFAPQVDDIPGLSLVFLNSNGTKRRLSLADAASLGQLDDQQFLSATVLMRPVLERALLPTASYVGGPGEIAYFAQVSSVADAMGVPAPLVVPRWSATILEPRIQRILDGLGAGAADLAEPNVVETRVAKAQMTPAALQAIATLRSHVGAGVDALRAANGGTVDERVLEGLSHSLEHRIQRAERRFVAGVKRREIELMRLVSTARGALYPYGTRQERKLAYIPFLARYGPALVEDMLGAARTHARAIVSGAQEPAVAGA